MPADGRRLRVVIVDNYDSYVYNLYQLIGAATGHAATVVRNDRATVEELARLEPTHLVLSPGPGTPENPAYFGIGRALIERLGPTTPLLGVCLGHQGIAHAFGARVVRAPRAVHGKRSEVFHSGQGLFAGLPNPLTAMRYHSLVVAPQTLPPCLEVTATTADGLIMGLRHVNFPIQGVQFHPESIGTPDGRRLLENWLGVGARTAAAEVPGRAAVG